MFSRDLEGHAPSWPWTRVLTDATAARPSIWLRLEAALGSFIGEAVKLFRGLDGLSADCCGGAAAIGNFDGVHLGHARIIERLRAMAARVGGPATVFTFDPPPNRILRPEQAPMPLCWLERKVELLSELGVDVVVAYPTDAAFLAQTPEEFFDRVVLGKLHAKALVEGRNFLFGRDRTGDVRLLEQFCQQAGLLLEIVDPVQIDGAEVSSSRIRQLLACGQIAAANRLLGRPHRIRGRVVRGAGRGNKLGFPTANLDSVDTLLPAPGIYAGRAEADGCWWPAAISLGPNPTFDESVAKIEAYLLDYQGCLYDRPLTVDFLARLREIKRFDSVDNLIAEMTADVAQVRRIVSECCGAGGCSQHDRSHS